jgi:ankyrin repeat protein
MWAAAEGNGEAVRLLIEAGADFRARVDSGFDAFLFAARDGRSAAIRALLKAGADPNDTIQRPSTGRRGSQGRGAPAVGTSALLLAVTNGHFDLAAQLLEAGADPNANATGLTALHMVSHVRKPGVGDNDPAPDGSGNMTSLEFVKHIVARGAHIDARMTRKIGLGLTSLNTLGATPYFLAAKTADAELMRLLASLGADTKIGNADNATPLMAAAGLGTRSPGEDAGTESEVLEALQVALDHGADINAVDNNGETAMHGAAYKNSPGAVEFLARKGAKIDVWYKKNKQGWTPLTIAEGYRFGNYKPSPVTVEAFHKVMLAAGVTPPPPNWKSAEAK